MRKLRGQRSMPNALHSYFHSTSERQFQLRTQLHAPIRAKGTLVSRQIDDVIRTYPFLDTSPRELSRRAYRRAYRIFNIKSCFIQRLPLTRMFFFNVIFCNTWICGRYLFICLHYIEGMTTFVCIVGLKIL